MAVIFSPLLRTVFVTIISLVTPVFSLSMLLPLYSPPDQNWVKFASIISANSKVQFLVVVSVSGGPGTIKSALYASGIQKFAALPNAKVLGYVDTSNGDCFNWAKASAACIGSSGPSKVSDVFSQIRNWISFYGASNIKGFYLDNFLPYNGLAGKSLPATSSVISDYGSIYKFVKTNYPLCIVAGNPSAVSPSFKAVALKVADVVASNLPAASFLANGGSLLLNIPQGYSKALVADKLSTTTAAAQQQISSLIAIAKAKGVQYFGAVRQESVYPSDIIPFQVAALQ